MLGFVSYVSRMSASNLMDKHNEKVISDYLYVCKQYCEKVWGNKSNLENMFKKKKISRDVHFNKKQTEEYTHSYSMLDEMRKM